MTLVEIQTYMLRCAMKVALEEHGTIRGAAGAVGMKRSTFYDQARAFGLIDTPKRAARKRAA